ncbi:MAG: sodium-translocating pyrophosphatase [Thermoplasmata archaeon]|nr:sodium-translocating pyrophosphatase [Thermoplasmata archaeon]MCI4358855.1 sodium-translocating pyrophosphatase [Thermoplasmata archaeon]
MTALSTGQLELVILIASLLSLAYAGVQTILLLREEEGDEKMRSIAAAIREGAEAFLRREYTAVFAVAAVLSVLIGVAFEYDSAHDGWMLAVGFLAGAGGSALAGAIGMLVSVRANVRTAAHARKGDLGATMRYAFRGGSVTGMSVAGLALLELVGFYAGFGGNVLSMVGVLFGASLMSLFARVGGGIYTKGADVGADLVGKVEAGIPEDDPRNPAVIADNVGDNVGDCAGMAADLFETYVVTAVSAMLLAYLIAPVTAQFPNAVLYPLLVCAWAIVATIVGAAFVRMRAGGSIMGALYQGLGATTAVGLGGLYLLDYEFMGGSPGIFIATAIGLIVMILIVVITDYYTSSKYSPVRRIAEAAQAGGGPTVITGLSVGLESAWMPGLVIVSAILGSYAAVGWTGAWGSVTINAELGLYGIGLAAASMLAVTGMIISIDAFGPITDNAGGIAEMANLPPEARAVTDPLDAVGNTTKAVTKGYAIGSAVLAALALFAAYTFAAARDAYPNLSPDLAWAQFTAHLQIDNPLVVAGLVIGGVLPFFFTSFLMNAVGIAAQAIVFEVRRQFKEIPGIMAGTAKPEYGRCVDIVTAVALRQLAVPAALGVVTPVVVGFLLGPDALAGLLLGVILSGFPLALTMTTGGGAWDNGKKYIEEGHYGGKHSDAHKAAVVGDTVGDATKDTAGPAINPLIKVVNTISILLIALIVAHHVIGI